MGEEYLKYTTFADFLSLKRLGLIVQEVRAYAQKSRKDKLNILELGCGIGGISFPLATLGHKVVGIDMDEKSIALCNERNTFPNASYQLGNAETLDLPERFDIVVASEIIEHCPHPDMVLQTIRRHLTEDGAGVVTVPNGYCIYEMLFSRLFQKLGLLNLFHRLPETAYRRLTGSPSPYHSGNIFCNHVQFFSLRKFRKLLRNHGFQTISVHNLSLGLLLDWKWLSPLKRVECRIADFSPGTIAGGWVFAIKQKGEKSGI